MTGAHDYMVIDQSLVCCGRSPREGRRRLNCREPCITTDGHYLQRNVFTKEVYLAKEEGLQNGKASLFCLYRPTERVQWLLSLCDVIDST
ncbi:hypothetical protein R1flu_002052 [Riccia fluitans]|uniref:Uncharacterized protein n=1 Tax=Riccia fluitans TaxID=41844 RepID=A0ABD1Y7Z0_9MARC